MSITEKKSLPPSVLAQNTEAREMFCYKLAINREITGPVLCEVLTCLTVPNSCLEMFLLKPHIRCLLAVFFHTS